MVCYPVQQSGGHFGVTKDLGPFPKGRIGGDDHRGPLIRAATLLSALSLIFSLHCQAKNRLPPSDQLVIRVIQLDHADAEHLASVLAKLLSPQGRIVAYSPTNSLIIKDKAYIAERLVEIIKGLSDEQRPACRRTNEGSQQ
jgi:type II secretory pathway component GspD/PulD (secretin)